MMTFLFFTKGIEIWSKPNAFFVSGRASRWTGGHKNGGSVRILVTIVSFLQV